MDSFAFNLACFKNKMKNKITYDSMVKEIKSSNGKKFYLILFLIWTLPFGTFLCISILFARLFPGFKKKE